jgi:hypothetical protein
MTVCIGAICDTGMIVGATDTMLTVGDVEFEPQWAAEPRVGKVFTITNSIVAMAAGAMGIATGLVRVVPSVSLQTAANSFGSALAADDYSWKTAERTHLQLGVPFTQGNHIALPKQ